MPRDPSAGDTTNNTDFLLTRCANRHRHPSLPRSTLLDNAEAPQSRPRLLGLARPMPPGSSPNRKNRSAVNQLVIDEWAVDKWAVTRPPATA